MEDSRTKPVAESLSQLGKYQVIEQIGEGAMGVVYRALDPVLNRPVAIKVMSEGLAQDQALRARFLREAQAAGSLQHPNVVTIYDFGETDGHLFIAMEFIEGADLEHLLENEAPIPLPSKIDIIIDVLNGLSYAHRRGIVHRDIKPANIRIDDEGHARIMDFGVARLATSNLTSTGVMMGTPNYMAPEQISGDAVTAAVDLFSVGAVLFELLTGKKPFSGDTLHSVLFKIVSDTAPDLRVVRPDLPVALNEIVQKALAKNPAERYRSAAEMANALSAVRGQLGPARVSKTVSQRISIERGLEAQRQAQQRERRGRLIRTVAASLVALVIVGSTAYGVIRRQQLAATAPAAQAGAPAARVDSARQDPSSVAGARSESATVASANAALPAAPDSSRATRESPRSAPPAVAPPPPRQSIPATKIAANQPASRPTTPAETRSRTDTRPAGEARPRLQDTAGPSATGAGAQPQTTQPVAPITQQTTTVPPPVSSSAARAAAVESITAVPARPAPTAENSRVAIASVIAAYASAIETRDLAEVRRVYPGMTAQQQSGWESFFPSIRSIEARFAITSLDVSGNSANVVLSGQYDYVTRAGRTEHQAVSLRATLQLDGERWRLVSLR